jgi:flagellar biosynthesis chaperone FliJ
LVALYPRRSSLTLDSQCFISSGLLPLKSIIQRQIKYTELKLKNIAKVQSTRLNALNAAIRALSAERAAGNRPDEIKHWESKVREERRGYNATKASVENQVKNLQHLKINLDPQQAIEDAEKLLAGAEKAVADTRRKLFKEKVNTYTEKIPDIVKYTIKMVEDTRQLVYTSSALSALLC